MLRVKDIAERFDVTEHTVLHWIDSGELKAVDVSRNRGKRPNWRISPEALEAFEQSRMPMPQIKTTNRPRRSKADTELVEFY